MEEQLFFEKRIDFDDYSVVLSNWSLKYIFKGKDGEERTVHIPTTTLQCSVDEPADGGKIEINYRDRWGGQMTFVHYAPSDLKGMFNFIAKGYDLGEILNIKPMILWK